MQPGGLVIAHILTRDFREESVISLVLAYGISVLERAAGSGEGKERAEGRSMGPA